MSIAKTILLIAVAAATAHSQLAWWGDYIPKRDKPPVIFVTGHDAVCPDARSGELPFFQLTFGEFDKVMARDGRISMVFEACYAPNRPPIEELGNLLRRLIEPLRYEGGEPVREIDIVAHSMGGLIVRSYLSGKQVNGTFLPPSETRVRKVVFLATPHFGTAVGRSTDGDPQIVEMSFGSRFLFDLATWNQGTDDLRGVDALAVAGTGGRNAPASDSVVTVGSASIDFATAGRTAVLPYCHTQGGIGQLFLCHGTEGVARVLDEKHGTAKLVLSFLNDSNDWRPAAGAPLEASVAASSSILVESRTPDDLPRRVAAANLTYDTGTTIRLNVSNAGIAYAEMLRAGPATLEVDGVRHRIVVPAGGSRAFVVKHGPWMESVEPAPGRPVPLVLAPGMLVSIKGLDLNTGVVELSLAGKPVRVISASAEGIVAELPDAVSGLTELRLRNAAGQHTLRVLLEPAAPSLWMPILRGGSAQAISVREPAVAGDIISVFLTGLGQPVQQPVVRVGGRACDVLYAGRAPGLAGVDQINCKLPQDLVSGTARLQVTAGNRSAWADVPVR